MCKEGKERTERKENRRIERKNRIVCREGKERTGREENKRIELENRKVTKGRERKERERERWNYPINAYSQFVSVANLKHSKHILRT